METDKIEYYLEAGAKDLNWYRDTENLFVQIYGRDKLQLVTSLFAATSINSSLKSNIRLFRRAMHEIENNLEHKFYLPNIRDQLNRIKAGKGLSGRKINSFQKAMSGDTEAVVVDVWLLRAFNMENRYKRTVFRKKNGIEYGDTIERSSGATEKQYSLIEEWVRNYAHKNKVEPRQISSVIWSGVRIKQSGDRDTRYHQILRHQLYSMFD